MRWFEVICAVLFTVLIVLGLGAYLLTRHMTALGAEELISGKVSQLLGNNIVVGNVRIVDFRTIEADDLTLYENSGAPMIQVSKAVLKLSPYGILSGMSPDDFISSITVYGVKGFIVEYPNKKWNLEQIGQAAPPKKEKGGPLKFHPEIRLVNARVNAQFASGVRNVVDNVNGSLNLSQPDFVRFSANIGKAFGTSIDGTGYFDVAKKTLALSLHSDRIDLYQGSTIFFWKMIPDVKVKLLSGYANNLYVDLTIRMDDSDDKGKTKFNVAADCENASADIFGVRIDKVFTRMEVNQDKVVAVNAKGLVFGNEVSASGEFAFGDRKPADFELNTVFAARNIDVAKYEKFLPKDLNLAATFSAMGYTRGKIGALSGEADVEVSDISVAGYRAEKLQAKLAAVSGTQIVVSDAMLGAYGGMLRASGSMDIKNMAWQFSVAGSNFDVEQIPAIAKYGAKAKASFSATLRGDGDKYIRSVSANLAAQDIVYKNYSIKNVVSGVNYSDSGLTIDYLDASLYGGQISAYGLVGKEMQLKARAYGLDGSQIAKAFSLKNIGGTVNAAVDVQGAITNPSADIRIDIENGSIYAQPYQSIVSNMRYFDKQLQIDKAEARDAVGGLIQASGLIDFAEGSIAVTGDFSDLLLQSVLNNFAPQIKLLGAVNGSFEVNGGLEDPVATAKIATENLVYGRYLINSITANADLDKSGVILKNADFSLLGGSINIEGTCHEYNDLDFLIKVNGLDLDKLPQNLADKKLVGAVSARMLLKGDISSPMLFGKVSSNEIAYNGQSFTGSWAEFTLSKETLDVNQGVIKHKAGVVKFDGSVQLADFVFVGNYSMTDMDIHDLLAAFGIDKPIETLNGALSMQGTASGTPDNPSCSITANIPTITSYNVALDNLVLSANYADRKLKVEKFYASRAGSVLAGRGEATIDGPVSFEIGLRNIDSAIIPKLLDKNLALSGNLNATAQVSGVYGDPQVSVSVTLDKPDINGTKIDELYGLLTINKEKIGINQFLISKSGYKASVYGEIPYAAMSDKQDTASELAQLDLHMDLDDTDLLVLPQIIGKQISSASGHIGAKFTVRGSMAAPIINGSAYVKNGSITIPELKDNITNINMDFNIDNNAVKLKTLHGDIEKGSIDVAGTGLIIGHNLRNYKFTAVTENLEINSKDFAFPLICNLAITDNGVMPKISGDVTFKSGDVAELKGLMSLISSGGKKQDSKAMSDIALDVNVNLGNKLRVYNPVLFDLFVSGQTHFGGTTNSPDVTGKISAVRGVVMYLRNEFNIQYADATFDRQNTFMPNLDIQAKAVISAPDPINPDTSPNRIYTLYLTVKGPAEDPKISLDSDNGLSQNDIMNLLTFGQIIQSNDANIAQNPNAMNNQINQLLNTGMAMTVFGSVESSVRTNLGLDTFSISRTVLNTNSGSNNSSNNVAGQEVYQMAVGKYILDSLLLKSTVGIGYNYYQLQAQYNFWSQFNITGSIDDQQNSSIVLNKIWKF